MAATRRLRPGGPACHTGAKTDLLGCHARRQHLNRCADKERQRQANRQETFPDRRHARKTWATDEGGSTLSGGADFGVVAVSEPPMPRDPLDSLSDKLHAPHLIKSAQDKEPIKVKAY
jgi:hypothetical protein